MGFQLLNQAKVDNGFGQRIAIRTADPRELNSLTRTTLDQRARTERASIPGGDSIRGFGAGDFGELVTRLVAKAEIPSLTGGEKPIRIRGADSLSVPLGKTPQDLLKDRDVLDSILREQLPAKELAVLEQLVAIKRADVIESLEAQLEKLRWALQIKLRSVSRRPTSGSTKMAHRRPSKSPVTGGKEHSRRTGGVPTLKH